MIELKTTELKPEHVGKLNFYLAVVDDLLRAPDDNPSIGLLLCRKKSKIIAEYALKKTDTPIGIAEYRLSQKLPQELIGQLPTPEMLEQALAKTEQQMDEACVAVTDSQND